MNVDVTINSGLNVEAVFSGNDIAVSVAFADPLKVDVEILAGTKGDSMFQQVGTEIIPIDGNATLDASFIANLPEIDNEVTELSTNPVKSSGIWAALQALLQSVTQALAELFIPTKTSDLQNDSNFITSSSLTKANIEGLKDTDSPTFADTLIPALADPASYDPATVAYLTELFGELSDSVKESILRTWGRLQDITNKVAGLQDGVIWEEVFEHDITTFELSVDRDGKQLDERGVLILVDGVVSSASNNGSLRLNSIKSSIYWNSVTNGITNSAIIYCNGAADNIFSGTIQCYKNNDNIIIQQFIGNSNTSGAARTCCYTASLPVSQNITNIHLNVRWRAGSQIKIYRL